MDRMGQSIFDINPTYFGPPYLDPPEYDEPYDESDAPGARVDPSDPDWGWLHNLPEAWGEHIGAEEA